ncbi:DUF5700 domain-containing putative Zn-dependent protease [Kordiimonas aquimaris]|uniref:DUF5700 domain-containing putative Zn-dependent protease n=1 Tax=Kordiimonas aquimaris TaxID=707591 RepID=UPI0021CF5AF3|nr:DUF5700 domain-containing putative Zn-dependent protease [Kordiimonas aquimaris]
MKIKFPIIYAFLVIAAPAKADINVSLDTGFAESVLTDVCSGALIDEKSIQASTAVKGMLSHFSQFRDYFTMDAYINARQTAANCEKSDRDIFRFNDVIDNKERLVAEVNAMKSNQKGYSGKLTSMLSAYTPKGIEYEGRATIAVGTPSCGGWSSGDDFYVDLPCIAGDQPGLQYLFAHESYHGIQEKFMPASVANDPLGRLLSAMMREGSATAIADFSDLESDGSYTVKSQQSIQKNARRIQQNFDLLEMALVYLYENPNMTAYDVVNNIGLSGSFDAPFYAVGAVIFDTVEAHDGLGVLLCFLQQPARAIVGRYALISDKDESLPRLGLVTLKALGSNFETEVSQCVNQ